MITNLQEKFLEFLFFSNSLQKAPNFLFLQNFSSLTSWTSPP